MLSTKDITKKSSKHSFPTFIKNNESIKSIEQVDKIFPKIGLDNCTEEVVLEAIGSSSGNLKQGIRDAISRITDVYYDCGHDYSYDYDSRKQVVFSKVKYLLEQIESRMPGAKVSGKRLNCAKAILDENNKVILKSGGDLVEFVKLISETAKKEKLIPLTPFDKIVGTAPVKKKGTKKLNITFSSDGVEGAWDIATMSMRGIDSCMRWGSGSSHSLVGSILDPCAGIIYITDNTKTKHGKKMLYRAVVRFVVDRKNKPKLMLERLYSSEYNSNDDNYDDYYGYDDYDSDVGSDGEIALQQMAAFLKRKTKNKYEVIDSNFKDVYSYQIPKTESVEEIENSANYSNLSYRDSGIEYTYSTEDLDSLIAKKKVIKTTTKKKAAKGKK